MCVFAKRVHLLVIVHFPINKFNYRTRKYYYKTNSNRHILQLFLKSKCHITLNWLIVEAAKQKKKRFA